MEFIWIARLLLVFAALVTLAFSWRASVLIATCIVSEFMNMVLAGMPDAGFWNNGRMLLGVGLILGAVVSVGRDRTSTYWDLPILALASNALLTLSWGSSLGALADTWPAYLASVVALPLDCFFSAVATDALRRERERRRWRAQSSARE
jgi:hypothetical protein